MEIFVSDGAVSLAVKGEGIAAVEYSDGTYSVVLAKLRSGALGWMCGLCEGNGMIRRSSPNGGAICPRCKATGISREFPDEASALAVLRRHFDRRHGGQGVDEEIDQAWREANAELIEQVRAAAPDHRFLRKMRSQLHQGILWSPRQMKIIHDVLAQRAAAPVDSVPYGTPGEKVTVTGVIRLSGSYYQFGARQYVIIFDGDGDCEGSTFKLVGTSMAVLKLRGHEGDHITLEAVVKEHDAHQGVPYTTIKNAKLINLVERPQAERAHWPGTLRTTDRAGTVNEYKVRDRAHAHSLLARVFGTLGTCAVDTAELTWTDPETGEDYPPTTFDASEVLLERFGVYSALLDIPD